MKLFTFLSILASLLILLILGPVKGFALILTISLALAAFVLFAYEAAKTNKWTTTVPQEEFKFVMAGETLHKILPNLKDAGLDTNDEVTTGAIQKPVYINPLFIFLKNMFGIYWVSILYPLRRIFKYKIDKSRLVHESSLPPDHEIKDLVKVEPGIEVDSLRRYIPRPQFIPEVELHDRFVVDIVVMTEFEVINPRIPIFNYKGKFFPLLDAAIEGAVNDFGNSVDYVTLVGSPTGKGSPFSAAILGMVSDELVRTVGIRPVSCYIVQVGIPPADQAIRDATKAKEAKRLIGEGVKEEALARAAAITTIATANADAFVKPLEAVIKQKVDPNLAAQQVAQVLSTQAASGPDSKIVYYATSGAQPAPPVAVPPPPLTP